VALARTDVSEENTTSIIRVAKNQRPSSNISINKSYVTPKHRLIHEQYDVKSQKAAFFMATAVKRSDLT
jgi:hypothetical protein